MTPIDFYNVTDKIFSFQLPFKRFARKIINSFGPYSSKDKKQIYEKEWKPFPTAEYEELKSLMKATS
jgi:hypothetical protein